MRLLSLFAALLLVAMPVQAQPAKKFMKLSEMREAKPITPRMFKHNSVRGLLPVKLPIDWAGNLKFPMHGNDVYGDCYAAAAHHADETYTGNLGSEFIYKDADIIAWYTRLSGGDNGLDDRTVQSAWMTQGLAKNPDAKILDYLYIHVHDANAMQVALQNCMVVMFTLGVPDKWLNTNNGDVWDAPAVANNNNGHAVMLNGVDMQGRYKTQTWGSIRWMTQAGVNSCNADAWVLFTTRAFSKSTGRAPNGLHISTAAALWKSVGGKTIPQSVISQFPPDIAPTPILSRTITLKGWGLLDGTYPVGPMVP